MFYLIALISHIIFFIPSFALFWYLAHKIFNMQGPVWQGFWPFCIGSLILTLIF